MDSIVITGVGGLIGYHLANNNLKQGIPVIGIDRSINELIEELKKSPYFDFRQANLELADQTERALSAPVTMVYHLAGQTAIWFANSHPKNDFLTNSLATVNIMERMRELGGGKIVFASTGDVYENTEYPDELSPLKPKNFYGLSKLTAENYVRQYAHLFPFRYTVLRLAIIYGPHMKRNILYDILIGITTNKLYLHSDLNSAYDLLYIDDCIQALLLASTSQWDNKTVNISSGKATPVKQVIALLRRAMARQGKMEIKFRRENTVCKVYRNYKALSLGWEPIIDVAEGIKKTADWWLSNNESH